MIEDYVLKELGAQTRQFDNVNQMLVWYADRKASQQELSVPLELNSIALNHELLNETRATMAKITYCLREKDPEVDDCELRHVGKLPEWSRGWTDLETLANLWGFASIQAMLSAMVETEMYFRQRAKIRGLLQNGSQDSPA